MPSMTDDDSTPFDGLTGLKNPIGQAYEPDANTTLHLAENLSEVPFGFSINPSSGTTTFTKRCSTKSRTTAVSGLLLRI